MLAPGSRAFKWLNSLYTGVLHRQRKPQRQTVDQLAADDYASHGLEPLESRVLLSASFGPNLSDLLPINGGDGSAGIVINGEAASDFSGLAVSNAGDVNGDGIEDVLIGADGFNGQATRSGAAYLLFGKDTTPADTTPSVPSQSATFELSTIDGLNGYIFEMPTDNGSVGVSVSAAGDVNGDGEADIIIGASNAFRTTPSVGRPGAAYIVFGGLTNLQSLDLADGTTDGSIDLNNLNGANGFKVFGEQGTLSIGDRFGTSVSSAGDIDNDGFGDVIIGANQANGFDGAAYVIYGKDTVATPFASIINLGVTPLDGTDGFVINGKGSSDFLGISVSNAGDVNGDAFGDIIIGAFTAGNTPFSNPGQAYLIFGNTRAAIGASVDLSLFDGTPTSKGIAFTGINDQDRAGFSVSSAGDINNDGINDLVIAAPVNTATQLRSGQVYVAFGGSANLAALDLADGTADGDIELSSLLTTNGGDGSTGFAINGIGADDSTGVSVSTAGDFNGDGVADLIIGARSADPNDDNADVFDNDQSGQTFVVFGKDTVIDGAFAAEINLADIESGMSTAGVVLNGINPSDQSGISVSAAGDFNGDGTGDIIIGALTADPNGLSSGQSYIVFGGGGANNAPIVNDQLFTVEENTANGTLIATVAASDPDTGDVLTYSIIGGTGATAFAIDANTGQITVADGSQLDFELVASLSLIVEVHDICDETDTATITIDLLNHPDIVGRVFDDLNNNGIVDGLDAGLENVNIDLVDNVSSLVVATAVTDSNGDYTFGDVAPGSYSLVEQADPNVASGFAFDYLDGNETAGTLGGTVDNTQDSNEITSITVQAGDADASGYDFAEIRPSVIQGLVWEDFNNDGVANFDETAIENVTVNLTGTDDRGNVVSVVSELTDIEGMYAFIGLRPGDYTITETQPTGFEDGIDVLGTVNDSPTPIGTVSANDTFSSVVLPGPESLGMNYNFGERPEAGASIADGQTATIGFWLSRYHGQALIKSLNGGSTATQLGEWLAATFPNMYGDLAGLTNAQIASSYRHLVRRSLIRWHSTPRPRLLEARTLSVALSTYVTNETLAGTTAQQFGFVTSTNGLGVSTINVGSNGEPFGVADDTVMTVLDMLLATNTQSSNGLLYDTNGDGIISYSERILRYQANWVYLRIIFQGL